MTQTLERLELPLITYRALEQIARTQGITPADAVGNLVRQFHHAGSITILRDEYQQLAGKELARTLTVEEAARLETVAERLSDLEMASEMNPVWEAHRESVNELLQELKETLQTFPDQKNPS